MKILLTTKTLEKGGAEVLISILVPKLIDRGCEVHILYYKKSQSELIDKLEKSGAKVKFSGEYNFSEFISSMYNTYLYIKKFNPDVIFEHSPLISSFNRLISWSVPIVYLEHSVFSNYNLVTRYLNYITSPLLAKSIFCSNSVFDSHKRDGVVINNAIEISSNLISRRNTIYPGYKIVISVANVSKVKNHQMLIRAFEEISDDKVKLIIVGAPRDNQSYIESLVLRSKKKEDIILYGQSNNVFELLRQSDVFCLTSLYEGLPMSLLEAMSLGVVPICTNVGGISDVVSNNCGYVVDVGNVDDLTRTINSVLSNKIEYDNVSKNARRKILEEYNIENYMDLLMQILNDAANKR
ncbi:glycosyltransferase [Vibrio vulnificus]|uniref:glycosyltransferase n=1 Tax=Vibrio vulnificus TaxID=672 RepID=UPI001CDD7E5F|nr:glycosyltransferase [Vibrio vulnificus]MCA3950718.1 glycosyltransferase [Vibrio vulnificus]